MERLRSFKGVRSMGIMLVIAFFGIAMPTGAWAMVPFSLNSSGTSHINWSPKGASWDNRLGNYNGVTGNWAVVSGSPYHRGADYYADDWNWRSGDSDCGKTVVAPISGNIIYKGNKNNGYGNQVVIQSTWNQNFAWRGTHFENGSLTTATYVSAGSYVGRIGKTGLPSGSYCHLHSVLYKNIYSTLNGQQGRARLVQGLDLYNTGGPNIFAAPFYHDGSMCATYSNTGVVFFENGNCTGPTLRIATTGLLNLPNYGWNDRARSMFVQPGKSMRIYEHTNGTGATRCINGTMWDLGIDYYTNGTRIVQNGIPSISSVRYYNNSNCQ